VSPRPEREKPGPTPETELNHKALADTTTSTGDLTRVTAAGAYVAALHRRRVATRGADDPWRYEPPGARGYDLAALHLLGCGLTPSPNLAGLRQMWRAGGESRAAAEMIAERWELAG
jgi:hypothetical protein